MKFVATGLQGVIRVEPSVFGDQRGYFVETWQRRRSPMPFVAFPGSAGGANRLAPGCSG